MNTIFALEHAPYLAVNKPELLALYLIVKNFCDSKGYCEVPIEWIGDHLRQVSGMGSFDTEAKIRELASCGLVLFEGERIKLEQDLSLSLISSQLKKYAFGEEVPPGYEALFDEKQLYQCYTTNGNVLWKVLAEVSRYLNLDFTVVKRLMENEKIKKKFIEVRKRVEAAAEISGQKVTKRKLKRPSDKTVAELYEQLLTEVHLKNEQEIPVEEWKSPQLLRKYCLLYKERYQTDYIFTTNPFGSFEMRSIKGILTAFNENACEAVRFLEWCMKVKSHEGSIKYPLTPKFCELPNVIREFFSKGYNPAKPQGTTKIERTSPLPTEFIEWIVKNYPHIQETYHLSKMEELMWMKKSYDEKDLPHPDLSCVIEHAIQVNLIPKTGELTFG